MADMDLLPVDVVVKNKIILTPEGVIYSPEPKDIFFVQRLYRFYGVLPCWTHCSEERFNQYVARYYGDRQDSFVTLSENSGLDTFIDEISENDLQFLNAEDAPVIRLIDSMVNEACELRASDIHIESFRTTLNIRFRIDGFLQDMMSYDVRLAAALISRIKIMAGLDIAERRLPQDGRIIFEGRHQTDIRVSVIPVAEGERVVLRLLNKDAGCMALSSFGLPDTMREKITSLISRPHGMVLVTGPTGSGKSTSLYAFLNEICSPEINILTIEDPVEYQLKHIGQTQVNANSGMTFSRGLRALLRQDPDVVMIGEIRDSETASIAVQAALTGHLVFSTLHTNTAAGTITRLRDMGIESFLIASVLTGVIAQRLVRVLCPHCKRESTITSAQRQSFGLTPGEKIWEPLGCEHCHYHGYQGRTGIFEILCVDDATRRLIHDDHSELSVEDHIRKTTPGIMDDGISKVRAGITTLSELMRVTSLA